MNTTEDGSVILSEYFKNMTLNDMGVKIETIEDIKERRRLQKKLHKLKHPEQVKEVKRRYNLRKRFKKMTMKYMDLVAEINDTKNKRDKALLIWGYRYINDFMRKLN